MSNTEEMEKFFDIVQMHCICKADSNYSCKHVVAVLLCCNRWEHCYTEYKTQWLNDLNEKCECRKIYLKNCNFMTGNATNIQETPDHRLRYLIFLATHYACPQIYRSQIYWFSEFAHCRVWIFCGKLNSDFFFIWGTIQSAAVARTTRFPLLREKFDIFHSVPRHFNYFFKNFFCKLLEITEIKMSTPMIRWKSALWRRHIVSYAYWPLVAQSDFKLSIPFEVLTARERNILFQSQKRREEVSSWKKILQCNWSVCFREVFREKSNCFIYNCGLGGSLFTLRLRRAISYERELRR